MDIVSYPSKVTIDGVEMTRDQLEYGVDSDPGDGSSVFPNLYSESSYYWHLWK